MSHSVETHCKLKDFLCKRDGESWSWVQCTPAWTFTMFEWLGEIPGGTIAVETEQEGRLVYPFSEFKIWNINIFVKHNKYKVRGITGMKCFEKNTPTILFFWVGIRPEEKLGPGPRKWRNFRENDREWQKITKNDSKWRKFPQKWQKFVRLPGKIWCFRSTSICPRTWSAYQCNMRSTISRDFSAIHTIIKDEWMD